MRIARVVRMFALLGVFTTLPGVAEAMEDGAHWLREGHTVHDQGHTDADHDGDAEHGCSGMQHVCRCCPTVTVIPVAPLAGCAPIVFRSIQSEWPTATSVGAEERAPAFRPPIG